jgi:hypothetical protein
MAMCPPGSGGGCGAPALVQSFFLGDQKPLEYNITPSDLHAVGSATYTVLDASGATFTSGEFTVDYPAGPYTLPPTSNLITGLITWSEIGTFIVRITITWDDEQVDHSVWAQVQVYALPTVGGC